MRKTDTNRFKVLGWTTDKTSTVNVRLAVLLVTGFLRDTIATSSTSPTVPTSDYCLLESFEPSCPDGQIILMLPSYYGRMRVGRCLTRDYYVGCGADVTSHLDITCSGKGYCHVPVPEYNLLNLVSCPKDLVAYLQADYECITAEVGSTTECDRYGRTMIAAVRGYLTNHQARLTGPGGTPAPGGTRCPYQITAQPGQRIHLTLYTLRLLAPAGQSGENVMTSLTNATTKQVVAAFKDKLSRADDVILTGSSRGGTSTLCNEPYASIREMTEGGLVERIVCAGKIRQSHIYTSQGHVVTVVMYPDQQTTVRHRSGDEPIKFILKFEAIGCSESALPVNARVNRQGPDDVKLSDCNNSRQSFTYVVCHGTEWIGHLTNCSNSAAKSTSHSSAADSIRSMEDSSNQPDIRDVAMWYAVSIGVAVGVFLGFCLLLLLHSSRRRFKLCQRRKSRGPSSDRRQYIPGRSRGRFRGRGRCRGRSRDEETWPSSCKLEENSLLQQQPTTCDVTASYDIADENKRRNVWSGNTAALYAFRLWPPPPPAPSHTSPLPGSSPFDHLTTSSVTSGHDNICMKYLSGNLHSHLSTVDCLRKTSLVQTAIVPCAACGDVSGSASLSQRHRLRLSPALYSTDSLAQPGTAGVRCSHGNSVPANEQCKDVDEDDDHSSSDDKEISESLFAEAEHGDGGRQNERESGGGCDVAVRQRKTDDKEISHGVDIPVTMSNPVLKLDILNGVRYTDTCPHFLQDHTCHRNAHDKRSHDPHDPTVPLSETMGPTSLVITTRSEPETVLFRCGAPEVVNMLVQRPDDDINLLSRRADDEGNDDQEEEEEEEEDEHDDNDDCSSSVLCKRSIR